LKPENFLLESGGGTAGLKLTDFGLSAQLATPDDVLAEGCGSAYYIAPEIFNKHYTKNVDVFALGVILFIMLSGTVPFGGDAADEKGIFRAIQTQPLVFGRGWESITAAAKELIAGMLEKDPSKRYTVEQALAHPWITGDAASDKAIDRSIVNALLAFNARNKLKKAAIKLVANHLTAKDVQSMRSTFMKIDTDNSGLITTAELVEALKEMRALNKDEVKALVEAVDVDKDGRISWEVGFTNPSYKQLEESVSTADLAGVQRDGH
jgi:calcium-dependent protein kinase